MLQQILVISPDKEANQSLYDDLRAGLSDGLRHKSHQAALQVLEAEYPFERFEEFFTISYLLINPHTGQLRYSNAAAPPCSCAKTAGPNTWLQAAR